MITRDNMYRVQLALAQVQSLYQEVAVGSPAGEEGAAVSSTQAAVIQEVLHRAGKILEDLAQLPFRLSFPLMFESISQRAALTVIAQYLICLELLRGRHLSQRYGQWFWEVGEVKNDQAHPSPEYIPMFVSPVQSRDSPELDES